MSRKKKHEKVAERFFLNDSEDELGTMGWHVSPCFDGPYAQLSFRDCTRQVSLDFDWSGGDRTKKERIEKLDRIIASLRRFRKALNKYPEKKNE
jgi:hypothetical protein